MSRPSAPPSPSGAPPPRGVGPGRRVECAGAKKTEDGRFAIGQCPTADPTYHRVTARLIQAKETDKAKHRAAMLYVPHIFDEKGNLVQLTCAGTRHALVLCQWHCFAPFVTGGAHDARAIATWRSHYKACRECRRNSRITHKYNHNPFRNPAAPVAAPAAAPAAAAKFEEL